MFKVQLSDGSTHTASDDFKALQEFVCKRQWIFTNRYLGLPWDTREWQWILVNQYLGIPQDTNDRILSDFRFTNVYRVVDRTTQDLIRRQQVDGLSDEDIILRTVIFRLFNLTSTFDTLDDISKVLASTFNVEEYSAILSDVVATGNQIYNGAYVIRPAGMYGAGDKHTNTLRLVEDVMSSDIVDVVSDGTMEDQYRYLLKFPTFGPFIAYQMVVDFGYTDVAHTNENEFVVPGLGAQQGIRRCFPTVKPRQMASLIKALVDSQEVWKIPGTPSLGGRDLHAVDVQNVFCEVNKYLRIRSEGPNKHRNRRFGRPKKMETIVLPKKWRTNING